MENKPMDSERSFENHKFEPCGCGCGKCLHCGDSFTGSTSAVCAKQPAPMLKGWRIAPKPELTIAEAAEELGRMMQGSRPVGVKPKERSTDTWIYEGMDRWAPSDFAEHDHRWANDIARDQARICMSCGRMERRANLADYIPAPGKPKELKSKVELLDDAEKWEELIVEEAAGTMRASAQGNRPFLQAGYAQSQAVQEAAFQRTNQQALAALSYQYNQAVQRTYPQKELPAPKPVAEDVPKDPTPVTPEDPWQSIDYRMAYYGFTDPRQLRGE